jgi:uncharacterized protein YjdB
MSNLFKSHILLFFTLILLFSVCTKQEVNVYGSISGVVRDTQSKQPLEGVSVTLKPGGITKVTGRDGSYTFRDLEALEYTLTYTKDEYFSVSKETAVQAGVNNIVDITLELEPLIPILKVSNQSLDFGNEQTTLSLDISNTGKGALNWSITHTPSWFTCSPMAGTTETEKSSVTITVSRTQKEKGSYKETFSITSNGGSQDITVTMTVSGVNMTIEPVELNFGTLTTELQLTLTNKGTQAIDYTVEPSNSWIVPEKQEGKFTSTDRLKVMVNRASLSPGDCTGSLTINVKGELFVVPVKMNIVANEKPVVSIAEPKNITYNSATFYGMIEAVGKDKVTQYGFCWDISSNPTISNSFSNLGDCSTPLNFDRVVSGLESSTTYYVRAYAQNSVGISYSSELPFTTADPLVTATIPTVSTGDVSELTTSTAKVSGTVFSLGNAAGVTQHGHVWSTSPKPTITQSTRTFLGPLSQIASYASTLGNLSPNTTYYVRAFATNAIGTAYGNDLTFQTPPTTPSNVSVTGVSLDQTEIVAKEGATAVILTATVSPENATNKNVTWSTNNSSVATVSNGLVNFIGAGSATITVTTEDGKKAATCNVRVTPVTVPVTDVSLDQTSLTRQVGDPSVILTATVTPSYATNKNVTWSTNNSSVATVSNGVVSFVGAGSATITVTTEDGNKTATCDVTVTSIPIPVAGVSLDQTSLTRQVGDPAVTLIATVTPGNATNKNVIWSTNNSSVATVYNGVVNFVGVGSTRITVITENGGKTATCDVTVNPASVPVEGVSLDQTSLTRTAGASAVTLTATVTPSNATNKNVIWSTSNSLVTTVSDGVVSFVGVGSATITVTTQDGGKTASCVVTVGIGGTIGPLTWSFANRTLTISGSGFMPSLFTEAPWYKYLENIYTVVIQNGVRSIGEYAFYNCDNMTSITIPNSVESIGSCAFRTCNSLSSITIPNSVKSIARAAFQGCNSLTSIIIPSSVTSIGDDAFICANLISIYVDNTNPNYLSEDGVLYNKNKTVLLKYPPKKPGTSFSIPNTVTNIDYAFRDNTNLTSMVISNSITNIGSMTFSHCTSLTSITIPNSVTSIGYMAFYYCTSLTSIIIPNSVTNIDYEAFGHCVNLKNVVVLATNPPTTHNQSFYNIPLSSAILTVPKGCKSAYQKAAIWKDFGTIVEMD